jgi:hypothetical protein
MDEVFTIRPHLPARIAGSAAESAASRAKMAVDHGVPVLFGCLLCRFPQIPACESCVVDEDLGKDPCARIPR